MNSTKDDKDNNRIDPLTPFEMRIIKQQLLTDHTKDYKKSLTKRNKSSMGGAFKPFIPKQPESLSYLTRMKLSGSNSGVKKLSPRLAEFCENNRDQITKILKDSEMKSKQISEYPERREARLLEASFDNVATTRDQLRLMNPTENGHTYHFKLDIPKGEVMFKKELKRRKIEAGLSPMDKPLKKTMNSDNLVKKRVNLPSETFAESQSKSGKFWELLFLIFIVFTKPELDSEIFNIKTEGVSMPEMEILRDIGDESKLMYKNRLKGPKISK